MNLSTRLLPRASAERRGLFSAIAAAERPSWRPPFHIATLMVLGIRKLGLTVLTTATLCSTISRLVAADPSAEVFTQDGTATDERGGGVSFLPQLPVRWSFTASIGYDDNVDTTPGGAGSILTQVNLTATKDLRTERTKLSIAVGGGVVYYLDRVDGSPTDYTGSLRVSLHHDVSERLTLAASVSAAYSADPQFATDLGPARRENHFSTADSFTASYKWSPRLSTDSSYQLSLVKNADALVSAAQDRVDHTFGESFRYLWSPRTTVILDYLFELIDYDTFPRDSSTQFVLGGLDYQISPQLNASFRGGASFRKFKEGNGAVTISPNGVASLVYALGPSTSVDWTVSYSIEEPDFEETLSRTTFRTRTGLHLSYQLTRRLTANLGANYHHDVNAGLLPSGSPISDRGDSTEDGFEMVLGAKYAVTDRVALDLGYTHAELKSTAGYSSNRYTAGLSLSY